jgi:transcriptional regulator with XRE-family HTH domain
MTRSPNPTDVHVGKRIRMRRLEIEMSQDTLAGALGVSFQQVQKYEKGVNRVVAGRLSQIASTLDCPIAFFYENGPDKNRGGDDPTITAFMTSRDGMAIAQAFMSLPEEGNMRKHVRDVIVAIAKGQDAKPAKTARKKTSRSAS